MAGSEILIDILGAEAQGPVQFDFAPPFLELRDPAPAESGVEIERNISFRITDAPDLPSSGVDVSSLNVYIKEGAGFFVAAIVGGVFQAGFTGSITDVFSNTLSFDVVIDPANFLADGTTITVWVQVADTSPSVNLLDTTYTFTTEAGEVEAPYISNEVPARGAVGVSATTTIQFRINDDVDAQADSGVDLTTLNVQIESGLGTGFVYAIQNGGFVNGYTGSITDVGVLAPGLQYDVVIIPPGPLAQVDRTTIIVDVDDTKS